MHETRQHTKGINDIQSSLDQTMIITASKDNTAKVSELMVVNFLLHHLLPHKFRPQPSDRQFFPRRLCYVKGVSLSLFMNHK